MMTRCHLIWARRSHPSCLTSASAAAVFFHFWILFSIVQNNLCCFCRYLEHKQKKKILPKKKSKSFLFQLRSSSSECRDAKFSFLHPLKIWLNGDIDFNARFITLPLLVLNKKPFLLHPVKAQDFPSSRI